MQEEEANTSVSDVDDQNSRPRPPAGFQPNPEPSPHLAGTSDGRGRAIAQADSRWLPTAGAKVHAWSGHVGSVVDKVALGHVYSVYFSFLCHSLFHKILHLHNQPGQVQQTNWWPTCRVNPAELHPIKLIKKLLRDVECYPSSVKQKHWVTCTQLFPLVFSTVVLFRRGLGKQGGVNKFNIGKILNI
jgi:hypothetical protein